MKENFRIQGCFYRLAGIHCRKYLDIKRKGKHLTIPDLLVVMMNPGSSKPASGKYEWNQVTEVKPDRTQMQIMRVMNNCRFDYCRILNLTDIQETKSKTLIEILSKPKTKQLPHSIFDPSRKADFDDLYPKNTMTLLAWGVHDALNDLARQAIEKVGNKNSMGLKKENSDLAYYHPLPPSYYKQQKWVRKISKQLKNQKQLIKS
jgi:hypothetical protein